MSYHFQGMEDLLHEAFTRFADTIAACLEARLSAAHNLEQALPADVDMVHEPSEPASNRDRVITYELCTLAVRDRRYRAITSSWMRRSRQGLERHFDPQITRQIDALIEGLALHRALDGDPFDRGLAEEAVHKMLAPTLVPSTSA